MSTGSSLAYSHSPELGEPRLRRGAPRDGPGGPAPSWTAPQSAPAYRAAETERFGYAGSRGVPVGSFHSPPVLQTSQRMPPAGVHLHGAASVPFPARTGYAPQIHHAAEAAAPHLDCSWSSFCGSPETSNVNIPRPHIAEASALYLTDQAWDDMVMTPFASAPRVHPPPLQVRSWEASESTRIQPPSLINDTSSLEPIPPQNADDDQDAYTFLCEWTDENGTCNMEILGDRVWMSHHLSRRHNVVGHERSQRTCLWRGCADTMNKGSLARHVVSRHLRAGATCGFCSKVYSRADVARRHTKKCKVANGALAQRDQTK